MTDDTEDYTPDELDEMLGSVLYHGGIQAALAHFLHVTSDDEDLVLVEFVNHAPVPLAATVLAAGHPHRGHRRSDPRAARPGGEPATGPQGDRDARHL
jgi:hypothetical protein